ncbi:hypothetical protein Btru_058754 [Bulinus truncatus]|nr:hypothetical protein Btru_058754 [Bulinus truncatus]
MNVSGRFVDLILAQFVMVCVQCQTYEETLMLFRDKINPEKYRTEVRPLRNQSKILDVVVIFSLLSIVGIDDIAQSFTCNGFFAFAWKDEMIAWDPKAYSGQTVIHPNPEDIWRPRMILLNTLDKRDVFGDDMAFTIQRRPLFLLINTVLPVIFLSFLNILVFIIPADSGEKIGYGITVLLALSVFLSIVGGMLPRSSKTMPKVTIYLFLLLTISMLTVIDSIIIVYLHHLEEKEVTHRRARNNYTAAFRKVTTLRQAVTGMSGHMPKDLARVGLDAIAVQLKKYDVKPDQCSGSAKGDNEENNSTDEEDKSYVYHNKYKIIGKYIDSVSLVVFLIIWFGVTVGFMLDIAWDHIFFN